MTTKLCGVVGLMVSTLLLLAAAGCGDDDSASPDDNPTDTTAAAGEATGGDGRQNACPVEGCEIRIVDVQAEGAELAVTWETNFAPDFARNHVHVFWDTYTAAEVSNDASESGLTQGEWVPTGDDPVFVTEGAVSTSVRAGSSTVCVTAADRDHNVIEPDLVDCRDVADLLG